MLENGIIEQSFSPFSSPVTLVTKCDKTKRFCIDYRKVNELISSDVHPLPRIEDILDRLARAKYFSTADISSAYWQVPIHPDSRPLLAFATLEGLCQPTRLPFRLKTSPQIYERAMSQILQRHGLDCVAHYFDDFIIFSNTLEEHQNHLRQFLAFCEVEKLQLNFAKCEFFKQSINFLGYTITAGTTTPLTRNTYIIHAIQQPHNRKTLQSFLGAVNVYNKFIPDYACLRTPLNNLLKKDAMWVWDENCQKAFISLKESLTQHPILHLYKEGLPCQTNKWNKERTEAGTMTSWETTTRTAEEWEQKQGRNPRTETPMEKARRFMLPDGTPRCFTCYQTGHKHWDCPKRRPRGKYNFASNPVVEVSNSVESIPRVFSEVTGNTNRIIFRVKGQPGVNEKQTLNKVPIEKSTLEIGGTAMEKFRWTGMTNFCLITHINETHVGKLIFDSGANVSCIDEGIANALRCARMPSKLLIRGISGSVVSNTCTYLEVNIDGFDICGRSTIIPGNGEKIIFGVDILTNYHCKIMFRDESVELYRPKIGRDDHVVELNEERELERLGTITSDRKNPKQKYCILDDLEIAPRCKTRVKLKGPTVMAGILEPHPDCVRRTGLLIPSVHVSETVSEIFIDVINTRNEPVLLVANSCLLRSGGEIANVSFLSEQVGYSTTATCKYEPQKFDINPELSDSKKIDVLDVLYRYRELFSEEWNKAADIEPYHIKLKANTEPIRQKAYRRSPKERDIIEEQVKEMCEKGVIRKSTSPWASPVVLVKKSDGSYRFCVDYRKVNNVTEKFSYPLPDITDCLDRLAGMKYFSHTDFVSGYWQCPLDETSKPITAFTTGNGLYEFQVLPFGLTGAPGHFERIMDTLLAELKWSECMVYLDDVIVYGRDIREHNVRLTNVLECFRGAGLSLKPSKCRFAYQKLPILGHVVSENGVEPATDKIEAVKEFPIPKNVKQVRSFLGLCGYYRRFIKNFSKISKPLTCLTEKYKKF
ncbi:hypothetical protein LAZ67_20001324, partial [Cordylochernes scorpioides]